MQRILKTVAWPYAIAYMAMWLVFVWFANDGEYIRLNPACSAIESAPLPLWNCTGGGIKWAVVMVVDLALIATVWAPAFVAAAFANTSALIVAAPLVLAHVAGLVVTVYVMVRVFGWIVTRTVGRLLARMAAPPAQA